MPEVTIRLTSLDEGLRVERTFDVTFSVRTEGGWHVSVGDESIGWVERYDDTIARNSPDRTWRSFCVRVVGPVGYGSTRLVAVSALLQHHASTCNPDVRSKDRTER